MEAYRGGKDGLLGFFVGQVMKETGGKANPKVVSDRLREKLQGLSGVSGVSIPNPLPPGGRTTVAVPGARVCARAVDEGVTYFGGTRAAVMRGSVPAGFGAGAR